MPSFIPSNFTPRQDDYIVLQSEGIMPDFLDQVVTPEFIEYWTELKDQGLKKGKKSAWFTAYRKWARRAFHGKAGREWEDRAKYQSRNGGLKTDLFDQILDRLDPTPKIVETTTEDRPKYIPKQCSSCGGFGGRGHKCPYNQPGPAMSPEEAFDQLRKQGLLK